MKKPMPKIANASNKAETDKLSKSRVFGKDSSTEPAPKKAAAGAP